MSPDTNAMPNEPLDLDPQALVKRAVEALAALSSERPPIFSPEQSMLLNAVIHTLAWVVDCPHGRSPYIDRVLDMSQAKGRGDLQSAAAARRR